MLSPNISSPLFSPPIDTNLGKPTKTLVWGLLELSLDEDFRDLVHNQVLDTFDGDYNVLFKKLQTLWYANYERNLTEEMAVGVAHVISLNPSSPDHPYGSYGVYTYEEDVYSAMSGFGYEEDIAYLQIYIPFIDSIDLNEMPTICFGHQEVDTTLGYYWQGDSIVPVLVDEDYAKSHLVWVVSI